MRPSQWQKGTRGASTSITPSEKQLPPGVASWDRAHGYRANAEPLADLQKKKAGYDKSVGAIVLRVILTFFAVYLIDDSRPKLTMAFGVEAGERLPVRSVAMDNPTSKLARCARERQELVLELAPEYDDPNRIPGTDRKSVV